MSLGFALGGAAQGFEEGFNMTTEMQDKQFQNGMKVFEQGLGQAQAMVDGLFAQGIPRDKILGNLGPIVESLNRTATALGMPGGVEQRLGAYINTKLTPEEIGEREGRQAAAKTGVENQAKFAGMTEDQMFDAKWREVRGTPGAGKEYYKKEDGSVGVRDLNPSLAQEAAGRVAMLDTALGEFDQVARSYLKDWGAADYFNQAFGRGDIGIAQNTMKRFLEAALRMNTGAAAPQSEYDNYETMFTPGMTDTKERVKEKLKAARIFGEIAREFILTSADGTMETNPAVRQQKYNELRAKVEAELAKAGATAGMEEARTTSTAPGKTRAFNTGNADLDETLREADRALKRTNNPEAIKKRLIENNIDPSYLGL